MERVISVLFILAGLINLYPIIGVSGSNTLTSLYGIAFQEPNLLILMRHRAILLGLIGLFLIVAAFEPDLQSPAFSIGLVSMLSFVVIALMEGGFNSKLNTVVVADVIASILLAAAALLRWFVK
jgi:hypothetical protein